MLPDFDAQLDAFLQAGPPVVSSIMGLFPARFVVAAKARGIAWFACATTLAEALAAERAGADAIVAQGAEAGGHRGAFDAAAAERQSVGLIALLPRLADRLSVPTTAAGGIGDDRAVAAALTLGASAVQIGTALLRTPEAKIHSAWADALVDLEPEATMPTRWMSGRLGRAVATQFVRAAAARSAGRAGRTLSRAARPDASDEGSGLASKRPRAHATLGRPSGCDGSGGAGRRVRAATLD